MQALCALLGLEPAHPRLAQYLTDLAGTQPQPEVKAYPGIEYHNYRDLGLSLQFEPRSSDLRLAAIDVYNADAKWSPFPRLPLEFGTEQGAVKISTGSVGKDFVAQLGEPGRKGGGEAGGGGYGPGLWMEWNVVLPPALTLQVELTRAQHAGLNGGGARWDLDQAGSAPWHTLTLAVM